MNERGERGGVAVLAIVGTCVSVQAIISGRVSVIISGCVSVKAVMRGCVDVIYPPIHWSRRSRCCVMV